MCKKIEKVFAQSTVINVSVCDENLLDSYFFLPNKDKHQPVMWKVFFEHGNKLRKFRKEIAKTIESEDLVLNYGSVC